MSAPNQRTYCSRPPAADSRAGILGYLTCGREAVGPHPDPEKSYREPLCRTHLNEVLAERAEEARWTAEPSTST